MTFLKQFTIIKPISFNATNSASLATPTLTAKLLGLDANGVTSSIKTAFSASAEPTVTSNQTAAATVSMVEANPAAPGNVGIASVTPVSAPKATVDLAGTLDRVLNIVDNTVNQLAGAKLVNLGTDSTPGTPAAIELAGTLDSVLNTVDNTVNDLVDSQLVNLGTGDKSLLDGGLNLGAVGGGGALDLAGTINGVLGSVGGAGGLTSLVSGDGLSSALSGVTGLLGQGGTTLDLEPTLDGVLNTVDGTVNHLVGSNLVNLGTGGSGAIELSGTLDKVLNTIDDTVNGLVDSQLVNLGTGDKGLLDGGLKLGAVGDGGALGLSTTLSNVLGSVGSVLDVDGGTGANGGSLDLVSALSSVLGSVGGNAEASGSLNVGAAFNGALGGVTGLLGQGGTTLDLEPTLDGVLNTVDGTVNHLVGSQLVNLGTGGSGAIELSGTLDKVLNTIDDTVNGLVDSQLINLGTGDQSLLDGGLNLGAVGGVLNIGGNAEAGGSLNVGAAFNGALSGVTGLLGQGGTTLDLEPTLDDVLNTVDDTVNGLVDSRLINTGTDGADGNGSIDIDGVLGSVGGALIDVHAAIQSNAAPGAVTVGVNLNEVANDIVASLQDDSKLSVELDLGLGQGLAIDAAASANGQTTPKVAAEPAVAFEVQSDLLQITLPLV